MLLSNLNLLATASGGVARLRELILTLAVQGKLVPQDANDEPASELLKKIRAEKDRLIAEGKIKRDKPLAEIVEEEKPFGLPKGWEWVRLNSLLQKIGAGSTPLGGREVYVSSGVKFHPSPNNPASSPASNELMLRAALRCPGSARVTGLKCLFAHVQHARCVA
jgi:type I restriction enzyme S subunit